MNPGAVVCCYLAARSSAKWIENDPRPWDIWLVITTKADNQKRVVVPRAKPGQVYAVQENADGSFTLTAVKPGASVTPTCRLANEDGFPVAVPNQPIDEQAIIELLAEFP